MSQHELVSHLYSNHGSSFTGYIKGIFVVIILKAGCVELYFDRFGLFRSFYSSQGGQFMVSNTVSLLAWAGIELIPDKASLSMQALFHRVPGGTQFTRISSRLSEVITSSWKVVLSHIHVIIHRNI
ncbi:MAG: hypothetical protein IPI74_12110 [Bacteroidales bacterium]|nr:hypothetical protein [Bacteroidales bacterium]